MIPSYVLTHLGYDEFGNNPDLLTLRDKFLIDDGQYRRVDGNADCPKCGALYRAHPQVQGALWLHRGCQGLVKL